MTIVVMAAEATTKTTTMQRFHHGWGMCMIFIHELRIDRALQRVS